MGEDDTIHIATDTVRNMLGLVDRTRIFALLEYLCEGKINEALAQLAEQHRDGADMGMLLQDMLGLVHVISRLHLAPEHDLGPAYADTEREYAKKLAAALNVQDLSRFWQMLMKGVEEVKHAADAKMAADMVLIRLAHASRLPTPAEIIRQIDKEENAGATSSGGGATRSNGNGAARSSTHAVASPATASAPQPAAEPELMSAQPSHLSLAASNPALEIGTFEEIVALCEAQREAKLLHHLNTNASVIECQSGHLKLSKDKPFPQDVAKTLADMLRKATDVSWQVTLEDAAGAPTMQEQKKAEEAARMKRASEHPDVKAVLDTFPGSVMTKIRPFDEPQE